MVWIKIVQTLNERAWSHVSVCGEGGVYQCVCVCLQGYVYERELDTQERTSNRSSKNLYVVGIKIHISLNGFSLFQWLTFFVVICLPQTAIL